MYKTKSTLTVLRQYLNKMICYILYNIILYYIMGDQVIIIQGY